ncbi:MAG: hypothetical protein QXF23_06990 [Candidatus Bathyarchaeia archaeon]
MEKGTERLGILIHLEDGFVAYNGLCTHMQAEVEWNRFTEKIWCTLHNRQMARGMLRHLRPKVVVSDCLNFRPTRYNGNIFHNEIAGTPREIDDLILICPEIGIGLGVLCKICPLHKS